MEILGILSGLVQNPSLILAVIIGLPILSWIGYSLYSNWKKKRVFENSRKILVRAVKEDRNLTAVMNKGVKKSAAKGENWVRTRMELELQEAKKLLEHDDGE